MAIRNSRVVTCPLKYRTMKTAFFLSVTSACQASKMYALICKAPYLGFSNIGVPLFTRLGFLFKVATKANASRPNFVPAMHNQKDRALRRICVRCAQNKYLQRTSDIRHHGTTHLFVAYGRQDKGKPTSKQQLSKWLIECIMYSYGKNYPPPPLQMR